ncbi:MAG TPA: hypothetical protein VG294_08345 [Solirubrobacteraceae bacterium]|jgi:hypothetical protein|nr:hypothetical protein [Solirubrobacteraceae bacterium]
MRHRPTDTGLALAAGIAAIALAACGTGGASGSAGAGAGTGATAQATQLVKDTFTGSHKITSGTLGVQLVVTPSGSSTLNTPITLTFGGPFQALGPGRVGDANFTLRVSALGASLISVGLESVNGKGYVSLSGTSYRLPANQYRQIESRLSQAGSSSASGSGLLGKLGIDPLRWLSAPKIVGTSAVAGASTTHVRAGLKVGALIDDLSTLLSKASALGVSGAGKLPTSISPATKAKIVAAVGSPSVDLWTGTADKTLRKLAIAVTVPVTGKISSTLGGLKSAALSFDVTYENLGQPQTISAPTSVKPFAQFKSQAQALAGAIGGVLSSKTG